jgi:hypothetical protein
MSVGAIADSPLSEENAAHALHAYNLPATKEAIDRLVNHIAIRTNILADLQQKARAGDRGFFAWLRGQQVHRFNQQKEIESRLWYLVAHMQFNIERARMGRGISPDVFDLQNLLTLYYKNFPDQDPLLTGLIEESLHTIRPWLQEITDAQQNECDTLRNRMHSILSQGDDSPYLAEEVEEMLISYQDNSCSVYGDDQYLIDGIIAKKPEFDRRLKDYQVWLTQEKYKEIAASNQQRKEEKIRQEHLGGARTIIKDTGINIDEERFSQCLPAQKDMSWTSWILLSPYRYQLTFNQEIERQLNGLIKDKYIPLLQQLKQWKEGIATSYPDKKLQDYLAMSSAVLTYVEASFNLVQLFTKYPSIYTKVHVCALHELAAQAIAFLDPQTTEYLDHLIENQQTMNKYVGKEVLAPLASVAAMKEKLFYALPLVDRVHESYHQLLDRLLKVSPFQMDAVDIKAVFSVYLTRIKLDTQRSLFPTTYKEALEHLVQLKKLVRGLQNTWDRFYILNQWLPKETIETIIKENGNNPEIYAVLDKLQENIQKPKDHPLELRAYYQELINKLQVLIRERENRLKGSTWVVGDASIRQIPATSEIREIKNRLDQVEKAVKEAVDNFEQRLEQ